MCSLIGSVTRGRYEANFNYSLVCSNQLPAVSHSTWFSPYYGFSFLLFQLLYLVYRPETCWSGFLCDLFFIDGIKQGLCSSNKNAWTAELVNAHGWCLVRLLTYLSTFLCLQFPFSTINLYETLLLVHIVGCLIQAIFMHSLQQS